MPRARPILGRAFVRVRCISVRFESMCIVPRTTPFPPPSKSTYSNSASCARSTRQPHLLRRQTTPTQRH